MHCGGHLPRSFSLEDSAWTLRPIRKTAGVMTPEGPRISACFRVLWCSVIIAKSL